MYVAGANPGAMEYYGNECNSYSMQHKAPVATSPLRPCAWPCAGAGAHRGGPI